jgi:hypothetical protein
MRRDVGSGQDGIGISAGVALEEKPRDIKGLWYIHKWLFPESVREQAEALLRAGAGVGEIVSRFGESVYLGKQFAGKNLLLNEGINSIWTLVAGGAETAFNNANARLGVGDSTTAAAATQTDLQAATNKLYKAMDASYPTFGTSQKITFRSTFSGSEANFGWQEFSADNGGTALKNLNRLVSNQGTKTSGQTWQLTLEITLS